MLNIQLSKLVNIIIGNIKYNSLEGGGMGQRDKCGDDKCLLTAIENNSEIF